MFVQQKWVRLGLEKRETTASSRSAGSDGNEAGESTHLINRVEKENKN
jgi:hypothetical protein